MIGIKPPKWPLRSLTSYDKMTWMVKKILIYLFLIIFLVPSVALAKGPQPTPTPTPKPEYDFSSMTTYEMFWPVVAGKVPGDRFYILKIWRDKFIGFLMFSDLKKSEYLKTLANKRLVEAERLVEIGRFPSFLKTIKESLNNLEEGLKLLSSAPDSQSQLWLKGEYAKDLQKHLVVLERMKGKVKEEQKSLIEKSLESINGLIEEYQLKI